MMYGPVNKRLTQRVFRIQNYDSIGVLIGSLEDGEAKER